MGTPRLRVAWNPLESMVGRIHLEAQRCVWLWASHLAIPEGDHTPLAKDSTQISRKARQARQEGLPKFSNSLRESNTPRRSEAEPR